MADLNGDGDSDIAVYRPASQWFVREGQTTPWGATNDIPVPGDYDGDGIAEFAVNRPSTGAWFVHDSTAVVRWGVEGDIPVALPLAVRRVFFPGA